MSPFVTADIREQLGQARYYSLYAVLVHKGDSLHSGHYYCCVKVDGKWWKLNDEEVTPVDWTNVSKEQAYILFYKQDQKPSSSEEDSLHSLNPNNATYPHIMIHTHLI